MDARSLIQQDNDISDAICLGLQPKLRALCALPNTFRLGSALYPDLPDFPNYVQKASFLTTTQTLPKSGVEQASAAYSVTTAQPKKTPAPLLTASSAPAAEIPSPSPVVPAPLLPPAQSSAKVESGIQKPQTSLSPATALSPSTRLSTAPSQANELPTTSTSAVEFPNPHAPVPASNAEPSALASTGQSGSPAAFAPLSSGSPAKVASSQPPPSAIPLPDTTLTGNLASQYMVNTQPLSPGGLSITISETAVSLAPSAAAVVLDGSNTIDLTTPSSPVIYIEPAPNITVAPTHIPIVVIVINNHAPNPTGGSATRTTITVQSSMSVYGFGSNIIYGISTLPISAVTSAIPNTSLYTLEASAMIINS
jgi:hypothetical protein